MPDITDRDDYLINQALIYAAHLIAGMPDELRPASNRRDMLKLLSARVDEKELAGLISIYAPALELATGRPFLAQDL